MNIAVNIGLDPTGSCVSIEDTDKQLPINSLNFGDQLPLTIYLFDETGTPPPFIDEKELGMIVGLGNPATRETYTLAQLRNKIGNSFFFVLDLTTPRLGTLMGSAQNMLAQMEILLARGNSTRIILQQRVTIRNQIIDGGRFPSYPTIVTASIQ
jgi:hypothetical protein